MDFGLAKLKQINIALERAGVNKDSKIYKSVHSKFVAASVAGTASVREDEDIDETMKGIDMAKDLLKYGNKSVVKPKSRARSEMKLIASAQHATHKKKYDEFGGAVLNVKAFDRFEKAFTKAVDSGEYESGFLDSFGNWLNTVTPESLQEFVGMDVEAIQKVIGLEGTLGMEVARYLKEMSGTAASENEAKKTMSYIIGEWSMQEKGRATRVKTFADNLRKRAIDSGRSLVKLGYVGDTYDKWNVLQPGSGGLTVEEMRESLKNQQKGK